MILTLTLGRGFPYFERFGETEEDDDYDAGPETILGCRATTRSTARGPLNVLQNSGNASAGPEPGRPLVGISGR